MPSTIRAVRRQVREAVASGSPRSARTLKHELPGGEVAERYTSRDYTHVTTSTGHSSEPLAGHGKRRVVGWHTSHAAASHRGRQMERGGWLGVLVEPVCPPPGAPPAPKDPEAPAGTTPPTAPAAGPVTENQEVAVQSTSEIAAEIALRALGGDEAFEPVEEAGFEESLHPRDRTGKFGISGLKPGHVVQFSHKSPRGFLQGRITGKGKDHVTVKLTDPGTNQNEMRVHHMRLRSVLVPGAGTGKAGTPQADKYIPIAGVPYSEPGLPKGAPRGSTIVSKSTSPAAVAARAAAARKGAKLPSPAQRKQNELGAIIDAHQHKGPGGDAAMPSTVRDALTGIKPGETKTVAGAKVTKHPTKGTYSVEGDHNLASPWVAMQSIKEHRVERAEKGAGKGPLHETYSFGGVQTKLGDIIGTLQKEGHSQQHIDRYVQGLKAGRQVKEAVEQAVGDVLEAGSLAKASSPEPFSTSKTSNWVARAGGLPPYVQHIAHDLMEDKDHPRTESEAIRLALGIVKSPPKNWKAEARAAAKKAVAEWEAKKGASKVKEAAGEEITEADYEVAAAVPIEEAEDAKAKAFCVADRAKVTPTDKGRCPKCGRKLGKAVSEAVVEAVRESMSA